MADLGEPKAGAEGERDDRVVADVAGGRTEDQPLLVSQVPSVGGEVKEIDFNFRRRDRGHTR